MLFHLLEQAFYYVSNEQLSESKWNDIRIVLCQKIKLYLHRRQLLKEKRFLYRSYGLA